MKRKALLSDISKTRQILENPYAHLDADGRFSGVHSTPNRDRYAHIEAEARRIQMEIWCNRKVLSPDSNDPIVLLDPLIAAKHLGLKVEVVEDLGGNSRPDERAGTAGLVDSVARRVRLSRRLPYYTRDFTLAHELGHFVLHSSAGVMHRERPLGSHPASRSREEIEADKFAAFFLMPRKVLVARFQATFGLTTFVLNKDTAFGLEPRDPDSILSESSSLRVARRIAGAERYYDTRFESLASQFFVSVDAMAKRLIELGLV